MNETLDTRGSEYGRAWYLESLVKSTLNDYHTNERELKMYYSDYIGPFDAIVAKLMRLLENPEHVDSWRDIEGYARLARRHIEDGVWHGEETVKVTDQPQATYVIRGTIKATDSIDGEIGIPYTHYKGVIRE